MTDENFTTVVPPALAGERLDKIAATLFPAYSRVELTRWITAGLLTVDGRAAKPKFRCRGGEQLALSAEAEPREYWETPEAVPLDILFEDEDLLVLNKPAGLVVHPGAGNRNGTLVNGLIHHRETLAQLPRAGVVHRLDKDTSGVMVVAASTNAHRVLTGMIAAREVRREYLGITEGRMISGRDVDQPIGRDPHVRTRQAVRDDGKPAFTEFRVKSRYRVHTMVHARLHSGRTHQIRVHLQSIGFPLVGDRRYGARGRVPQGADQSLVDYLQRFPRQALHAARLVFVHPGSEKELEFNAPLPQDMDNLKKLLAEDIGKNA